MTAGEALSVQAQKQYAAAAHVPLIKSPSLRVPRSVELPLDIHPLPDSVTPYFVYPFVLEPHILTLESSRRQTLAAHNARRVAYLQARSDEKERRKRDALRKIAPGFDPQATPLVPVKVTLAGDASQGDSRTEPGQRSVMDDLADQLEALESK